MVLTLCYDAISRYSTGPDPLAMLSFGSLVILPGCATVAFMQEKLGRKLLAFSALFMCGVFLAVAGGVRNLNVSHGNFLFYYITHPDHEYFLQGTQLDWLWWGAMLLWSHITRDCSMQPNWSQRRCRRAAWLRST